MERIPRKTISKWTESDRKSTRLNSSHSQISYAVFCLKKKKTNNNNNTSQSSLSLSILLFIYISRTNNLRSLLFNHVYIQYDSYVHYCALSVEISLILILQHLYSVIIYR